LKAADDARHRALTGAPLTPILEALHALVSAGVWVEVSTPVIPMFNDDPRSLARMAAAVVAVGADVPWHLLRFTPDFHMRRPQPTPPETLRTAAQIGRSAGLRFVYVERALGPEGRNTSCPSCGHQVVERGVWCTLKVDLADGVCPR